MKCQQSSGADRISSWAPAHGGVAEDGRTEQSPALSGPKHSSTRAPSRQISTVTSSPGAIIEASGPSAARG